MESHNSTERETASPPRDGLFRGVRTGLELREERAADASPVLHGHFAVFNRWTEIDSIFEGRFMERISPGAFTKTFSEREGMRVLFQHGRDAQIGNKPLGPIDVLEEDDEGARYEVPMLDTAYNKELLPGLRANVYGASFRFRVLKERMDQHPEESEHNPEGIPERTIGEAQVFEFGPVTFPAYPEASAGVRSLTDEFTAGLMLEEPERFEQLISFVRELRVGRDGSSEDEVQDENGKDARSEEETTAEQPGHSPTPQVPLYGLPTQEEDRWRLR